MWKRGKINTLWDLIFSYVDLTFADHGIFRLSWRSWAELPGKMYRSNQPYPYQIKQDQKKRNIRSIINLRGERHCSSYYLEKNYCENNNIKIYNYPLTSRDIPTKEKIIGFFKLLDEVNYPCIMHCKSGADRAGLAAALYMIYKNQSTVKEARKQLTFKHLHIKYAKTQANESNIQDVKTKTLDENFIELAIKINVKDLSHLTLIQNQLKRNKTVTNIDRQLT